ncbi:PGF-CTERM-anchored ABC transporter substrate-binding protein [Halobellus sp. GM3]|uniref:PGF-CTERM-anchored ABC transporter substrate-binding protein n=1 Tax=Halobellus sp. GM3 TaxID=3458410 RepID=UPI00403D7266
MQRSALVISALLVLAAVGPLVGGVGAAATADGPITADPIAHDHDHDSPSTTCEFPYETTDATGAEVTLDSDPERIVTLNPSAAQTMWEIGARDEVVGVSQYASYLEGADEKENVSGPSGPSVERVLAAEPDLILVPNSSHGAAADRVDQLRAQGVPVFVFGQPTSLSFVAEKTETIGRLSGNCEAGTERADEIRRSIELMERALENAERPVGLNVFYGYTSGGDTFIGDVMETGGLRNGAAEAGITGFQPINDETVVEMNPEWMVAPEESPIPENEAYNSTTAVREDNVVWVDTNYLQQPAPRSVYAAETILENVHPDAYEEYRAMQADEPTSTTAADSPSPTATEADGQATTETTADSPGFGLGAALAALAAAALLARRQ